MELSDMDRASDGTLLAYTSIGSYPIIYLTESGDVVCNVCASNDNTSDPVVNMGVHWEGKPETCADCGKEIESAYGVPGVD